MTHRASSPLQPVSSGDTVKYVIQGEMEISNDPNTVLSTVLGSCISVCIVDRVAEVGGMNHFLLPGTAAHGQAGDRFGVFAMESLINGLLRNGASRGRLEAKIFGGAKVVDVRSDVGNKNIKFTRQFLSTESIPILSESVGGDRGRRIKFWPTTGRAKQQFLMATEGFEPPKPIRAPQLEDVGDLELF